MYDHSAQIPAPDAQTRQPLWLWGLSLVWVLAIGGGLSVVWAFDNTPGVAGSAPARWPSDAHLARAEDRPTLVLLAHPQCSCTRATLAELAEVLARAANRPKTYVLFLKPFGFAQDWEKTDLWQSAASLPDVTVIRDDEGVEASRFGALTSGETVLYDTEGALRFSGGITGARGHAGDNAGRASLLDALNHGRSQREQTAVFGCPLFAI